MNKKQFLIFSMLFSLPILALASTGGDTTFQPIVDQIKTYLGGSLGLTLVFLSFLGAAAAVAGFASMKVMFPVLGLTLLLHFGPDIITKMFATDGNIHQSLINQSAILDMLMVIACATVFVIGYYKNKQSKQTAEALKSNS